MALEIKFKKNTNQEGGVLLLTNITGVYDAVTNVTGLGAPNLERSEINIVPYVTFGYADEPIPLGSYIPDVSDEIPVPLVGDGVYPVIVFALPVAYDYSEATLADLQANAVSQFEFSTPHFQDLKATRKKKNLLEVVQEDDCKEEDRYLDAINDIDLQLFGAESDLCNDLGPAAHQKLTRLSTKIDNLRL